MEDAAKTVVRMVGLLARGVITPSEFGQQAIDAMLHDEACDPAAILRSLPADARAALVERVRQYAEKDYMVPFFFIGVGETPQDAIDRQPKLRELGLALLSA